MRKPLTVIIVTLSVVCTLKGMYQYNTNDQSVYVSKESKEALTALTVLIVTHGTQDERVKSGVCSFYATLHTQYCYSICYSCQKGWKCQILCIQCLLSLPRRKAIWAFCLGSLAVHQSVQDDSFVNFLGLVKLQVWLQARHRASPQFSKLKGTQQPGKSMGTKLHPPYPNQTACL